MSVKLKCFHLKGLISEFSKVLWPNVSPQSPKWIKTLKTLAENFEDSKVNPNQKLSHRIKQLAGKSNVFEVTFCKKISLFLDFRNFKIFEVIKSSESQNLCVTKPRELQNSELQNFSITKSKIRIFFPTRVKMMVEKLVKRLVEELVKSRRSLEAWRALLVLSKLWNLQNVNTVNTLKHDKHCFQFQCLMVTYSVA